MNEAEEERLRGEREHQRVTRLCQQAEARVQALQKTLRRAIGKSRPYFELKAQFSQILEVGEEWERGRVCEQAGMGQAWRVRAVRGDVGASLGHLPDQCGGTGGRTGA